MLIPNYFEDPAVTRVNVLPPRAYYLPSATRNGGEDRVTMLSGEWLFRCFDSVRNVTEAYWKTGDREGFVPVNVPGTWQNYGFDRHQYTNVKYPFPYDPPYVPYDDPCGIYSRKFRLSAGKAGMRQYLNFEGVDSCCYVFINGEFVGYHQVSHSSAEYDITGFLRDDENEIVCVVLKWCDGSYLEDQDKFRMSGIFRDVYILSRPAGHVADFFVRTRGGCVSVEADRVADIELQDADGVVVGQGKDIRLADPHFWNAEDPYLYTLLLHTPDEWIVTRVGLRDIGTTEKGELTLNGSPIKFRGVNRHDSDPVNGFAVTNEQLKRDLTMMKAHNINAVRTSHYPNSPKMAALCDELGLYIIAEADLETHGCGELGQDRWAELMQDERFVPAIEERAKLNLERDKNHPSVLFWSVGNECGWGKGVEKALRYYHDHDNTRLTHYESNYCTTPGAVIDETDLDTFSRMYPSPDDMRKIMRENPGDKRPFVLCEYSHAMGNGPGDLEEYWQLFHDEPRCIGGFIWEWCDHAIYKGKSSGGQDVYWYGGDHGEYPHDGNFCMDGLVYPDRRPHTGLIEYKNVIRPARVRQEDGRFFIENELDFTPLCDWIRVNWVLEADGEQVACGSVDPAELNVAPHETGEITLDLPEICGRVAALRFTQRRVDSGLECGMDQILLRDEGGVMTGYTGGRGVMISENEDGMLLENDRFRCSISRRTGLPTSLVIHGQEMLARPMEYQIYRAPTDNDRNIRLKWQERGLDKVQCRTGEMTAAIGGEYCRVESTFRLVPVYLDWAVAGKTTVKLDRDGHLGIFVEARRNENVPFLPRFGVRLFVDQAMENVSYFGYGPTECYCDKHCACYLGAFENTVDGLHEDYIRPQENGSHFDTRRLTLTDGQDTLTVTGRFSFNASHYTWEELTTKKHNYQLARSGMTVVSLDGAMSGVGSNSCGPRLAEKYQTGETFSLNVKLDFDHK